MTDRKFWVRIVVTSPSGFSRVQVSPFDDEDEAMDEAMRMENLYERSLHYGPPFLELDTVVINLAQTFCFEVSVVRSPVGDVPDRAMGVSDAG